MPENENKPSSDSGEDKDNKEDENRGKCEHQEGESYNFDTTTILLGIQILPATEKTSRIALLTIGIKGEMPITISTSISNLSESSAIAQGLNQLKEALPQMASTAKARITSRLAKVPAKKSHPVPELPQSNTTSAQESNQLSLFA